MDYNRNMTEDLAVLATVAPQSLSPGTATSGAFRLGPCKRAVAYVHTGAVGAGDTVAAKLQWSATSGGMYADVTGGAIVTVNQSTETVAAIEIRAETCGNLGVGPYFKLLVTTGAAASPVSGLVLGSVASYGPASDFNVAAAAAPVVL